MRKALVGVVLLVLLVSAAAAVHAQGGRLLGVAMAAAGRVMMMLDPDQPVQPTQPGIVSDETLIEETVALLADAEWFAQQLVEVDPASAVAACGPDSTCAIYVTGAINGSIIGAAATLSVATFGDRTVYAGRFQPFIPYRERSAAMKYGGAALVFGGAALAALWPDQPAVQNLSITPTAGGVRVAKAFGW